MTAGNQLWTAKWIADKLQDHSMVYHATVQTSQIVRVERKGFSQVTVATLSAERVTEGHLTDIMSPGPEAVDFALNIARESYWSSEAIHIMNVMSVAFGGVADLYRALRLESVRQYEAPEFRFVRRGIEQHHNVRQLDRLEDRGFLIKRYVGRDLLVVFLNDYDLTADRVRTAREWYGDFEALVRTNPSSRVTSSAREAANAIKVRVLSWRHFLGYLRDR